VCEYKNDLKLTFSGSCEENGSSGIYSSLIWIKLPSLCAAKGLSSCESGSTLILSMFSSLNKKKKKIKPQHKNSITTPVYRYNYVGAIMTQRCRNCRCPVGCILYGGT
jgi:hypothetical protein